MEGGLRGRFQVSGFGFEVSGLRFWVYSFVRCAAVVIKASLRFAAGEKSIKKLCGRRE